MAAATGVPDQPWRVVLFTNVPGGAVYKIVDETISPLGHRIVGVVTTPGPPRRRSSYYLDVVGAVRPGIDIIVANHPNRMAAMIAPMRPDLVISGGFPYLIPPDVVSLPRLGAINMHPARLPKYRGPWAIEWAFRNGDPELGMTIHRIATDFDTGPILVQDSVPIHEDDDFLAVLGRLESKLPELLVHALECVARGDAGEPQDESLASYAGVFEPGWKSVDWANPARTIHNQVRSWAGFQTSGAMAQVDGEAMRIIRTRLLPECTSGDDSFLPGAVIQRTADRLTIQCGDGPLDVIAWELASA
jgi:methionyl-tRNA formyltransferase